MSEQQYKNDCIFCQFPITQAMEFCPACGHENPTAPPIDLSPFKKDSVGYFKAINTENARKGKGPFNFAFPTVENAYKFHESGEPASGNLMRMVLIGVMIGIIGGIILYGVHFLAAYAVAWLTAITNSRYVGALIYLLLFFGTAGLVGYVIGSLVAEGAFKANNRRIRTIRWVTIISIFITFVAYLAVAVVHQGVGEVFDTFGENLRLVGYLILMMLFGLDRSQKAIKDTPYCEHCKEKMEALTYGGVVPKFSGIPLRREGDLLRILNSRQFEKLSDLLNDQSHINNYSILGFYFCDICRDNGFLNAHTIQTRFKGDKKITQSRLIYSSLVTAPEIKKILAFFKPLIKDWEYDLEDRE